MDFMKKLHKWLSLIVGLQLILWLLSGLGFNLLEPDEMSGRIYRNAPVAAEALDPAQLVDPKTYLGRYQQQGVVNISQISVFGRAAFKITTQAGQFVHYADSGLRVVIDESLARDIVLQSYSGPGDITALSRVQAPVGEMFRAKGPLWRAQFDDELETRVYLSAETGKVITHRNNMTGWADLFFKLHFMDYDYDGGLGFNHWLIIAAAVLVLWLGISGVVLVIHLLASGNYQLNISFLSGLTKQYQLALETSQGQPWQIVAAGNKLSMLESLAGAGVTLPSGCGGGGSCGQCQVQFKQPIPAPTANEKSILNGDELARGLRLACQHKTRQATTLILDEDNLCAQRFDAELISSRYLTPCMKELRFQFSGNRPFLFEAGACVQLAIPTGQVAAIPGDLPSSLTPQWQHLPQQLFDAKATTRAYSMANYPGEFDNELILNVRYQAAPTGLDVPPGRGSSYLFDLQPGSQVSVTGPFGDFKASTDKRREMVVIGGGAGMAPLRSIVHDVLNQANRHSRISYWYGARSRQELFYHREFERLASEHNNFSWHPVLSEPVASDDWQGPQGFIHEVAEREFLTSHAELSRCDFYLCGPPLMLKATIAMLQRLGVSKQHIFYDDFGI